MSRQPLFTVDRIYNGWIVTVFGNYGTVDREQFCSHWGETEKLLRNIAFPYPDKNEPRGPKP